MLTLDLIFDIVETSILFFFIIYTEKPSLTEPVVSYRAVNKSLDDGVSHVRVDPRQGDVPAEPVAHEAHQEVLVRTVVIAD